MSFTLLLVLALDVTSGSALLPLCLPREWLPKPTLIRRRLFLSLLVPNYSTRNRPHTAIPVLSRLLNQR